MQIIPFNDNSSFYQQITLDSDVFFLHFRWNALNEFWVMSIYDIDYNPIILSIKIVPSYPLLAQYTMLNMPKGEMVCHNIVSDDGVIRRFDMQQKFELVYYSKDEWDALRQAS